MIISFVSSLITFGGSTYQGLSSHAWACNPLLLQEDNSRIPSLVKENALYVLSLGQNRIETNAGFRVAYLARECKSKLDRTLVSGSVRTNPIRRRSGCVVKKFDNCRASDTDQHAGVAC